MSNFHHFGPYPTLRKTVLEILNQIQDNDLPVIPDLIRNLLNHKSFAEQTYQNYSPFGALTYAPRGRHTGLPLPTTHSDSYKKAFL